MRITSVDVNGAFVRLSAAMKAVDAETSERLQLDHDATGYRLFRLVGERGGVSEIDAGYRMTAREAFLALRTASALLEQTAMPTDFCFVWWAR